MSFAPRFRKKSWFSFLDYATNLENRQKAEQLGEEIYIMFAREQITFEKLPEAVEYLISKVEEMETLLTLVTSEQTESDKWFNVEELSAYLPDKPARQTVYGWIGQRLIPYHKKGKKLQFLKSEIDS